MNASEVAMPIFQYSTFLLVLLGFSLQVNALELAERAVDDEPQPYCILGSDEEGVSKFPLGGQEYLICSRGRFFNFEIDPNTLGPIGCTICPRNTHYMDSRNFCPRCKRCTVLCGDNEVEIQPCAPYRNRICEPTIVVPSNVTVGNQYDLTTLDSTTDAFPTLTSAQSPTCPPCVSCAPTVDDPSTLTSITRKAGDSTKQNEGVDLNVVLLAINVVVLAAIIVILVWTSIKKCRKTQKVRKCKKQRNRNARNPSRRGGQIETTV